MGFLSRGFPLLTEQTVRRSAKRKKKLFFLFLCGSHKMQTDIQTIKNGINIRKEDAFNLLK